jgi:hypothetical protein
MSEEIRASAQYGDMQGTIEIDGWEHISAIDFGGCDKGYWPVGVNIYAEPDERGGEFEPSITILAVDESILDGKGPNAIRKYAEEHGTVPVFQFRRKAKLEEVLPLIKRVSIVLQDKCIEDAKLRGKDESYGDE